MPVYPNVNDDIKRLSTSYRALLRGNSSKYELDINVCIFRGLPEQLNWSFLLNGNHSPADEGRRKIQWIKLCISLLKGEPPGLLVVRGAFPIRLSG